MCPGNKSAHASYLFSKHKGIKSGGMGREFIILGINGCLRKPIFGVPQRGNGYSILWYKINKVGLLFKGQSYLPIDVAKVPIDRLTAPGTGEAGGERDHPYP